MARGAAIESSVARAYLALGDHERTLDTLERVYERRSGWILPFLRVDPMYSALASRPRFQALLERIGGEPRRSARLVL